MNAAISHTDWGFQWKDKLHIAGPCGAESEAQLYDTIRLLHTQNYDIIRAGIWKPRTKPGMFEGVGNVGLKWLKNISTKVQKPCMTEVANTEHVEAALKEGIDILWVGARTTVNPFQVQEIAEALKGVDIPIFVKNPLHADLELWIGAIERFLFLGHNKVAAIHRGFYTYKKTKYRNTPRWSIALELKRKYPNLSVITDPSHIGGKRSLISVLAQQSYDLLFDGLMIETHHNPDIALSDAMQQVTPHDYNEIIENLQEKKTTTDNQSINFSIEQLREKIDDADGKILDEIQQRLVLVEEIANLKIESNLSVYQNNRWNELIKHRLNTAMQLGLDENFIQKIWDLIHEESLRIHQNLKPSTNENV